MRLIANVLNEVARVRLGFNVIRVSTDEDGSYYIK